MIGASKAQCARLETCVPAESNAGIVGLRTKPHRSRDRAWLQFIPAHAQSQLKPRSSTRDREFREWKRTKASLLCSEHDAHLITGDVAMLTSMKLGLATTVAALSIAAVTSAGAAVNPTSAGEIVDQLAVREQSRTPGARQCWITADDNDHGNFGYWGSCSSPNASAAPAPASPAFEMQAQARHKCEEDLGYGRTGLFGCGG